MSDAREILRRLDRITDQGTIRQQISAIQQVLGTVSRYVAEIREEEKLLKSLSQLDVQRRRLEGKAERTDELRELEATIAEIKQKEIVVEQKSRAVRELKSTVERLASLLN